MEKSIIASSCVFVESQDIKIPPSPSEGPQWNFRVEDSEEPLTYYYNVDMENFTENEIISKIREIFGEKATIISNVIKNK